MATGALGSAATLPRPWPWLAVFGAAYVFAAWAGQALYIAPELDAALWPPSGIFLAALLLCDKRQRLAVAGVGMAADLFSSLTIFGFPGLLALAVAAGNVLEAVTGAFLLRRWSGSDFRLEGAASILAFTVFAALLSPLLSMLIGGTAMSFHTAQPLWVSWRLWWTGDAAGVLIFAPLLLVLLDQDGRTRGRPEAGPAEVAAMLGLLLLMGHLVMFSPYPTIFLLLPVLIWAAMRGECRAIALANVIMTLQVVLYTQRGLGPFAADYSLETRQFLVQSFILAAALTGLVLAGQACNRRQSISELKAAHAAAEAALESAEAARLSAERASQVKSRFLANMSHELRTPLNAVIGLSQLLRQRSLPDEVGRYVGHIHDAGEQLLGLVSDVLDLSRIEAGEMVLESVAFDPAQLFDTVLAIVRPPADAKGLALAADIAPELPPSLMGDPLRLRQVLLNLLSNAVKFTPEGRVTLRVRVLERHDHGVLLRLEVADTGIGIAPEQLKRIFAPFTQADSSTTRRFGGTGLGLSIVQYLVELMGGELAVDSRPDHGSTFSVSVPLRTH